MELIIVVLLSATILASYAFLLSRVLKLVDVNRNWFLRYVSRLYNINETSRFTRRWALETCWILLLAELFRNCYGVPFPLYFYIALLRLFIITIFGVILRAEARIECRNVKDT